MSQRITIYDTTLRDGSQGEGVNFSLEDKLAITRRLDELGVDLIEGGYPLSNPKDAAYFRAVRDLSLQHARVSAFGMTRRRDISAAQDVGLRALLEAETAAVTLVGKSWDRHALEILGVSLDENLRMIADSVACLADAGREVIYDAEHFFDGYRHNPEYAIRTLRAAADAGASVLVLCDTNGGSLPGQVARSVRAVREAIGTPVGIHTHNDGELAVANTLAAVEAGAVHVQGTINGIGERCGNVDLCSVVANLALKYEGYEVLRSGSLTHLTEVSRYVYETANMNFRPGQPFVGASAFAHKGGMHVHAVRKAADSYEHIDPAAVGNERRILVSELSGRSNIAEKLAEHGLEADAALLARVLDQVQEMENQGYQFEAAEATFVLLVERLAGRHRPAFERLGYRVRVEVGKDGEPTTEASIKLRVGDAVEHTVSEGDGPVNALDGALRKALLPHYPSLASMSLVDYKVRVINERAGTAARVRVVIESRDGGETWGTVGVSENIIEASWLALVDAVEHALARAARGPADQQPRRAMRLPDLSARDRHGRPPRRACPSAGPRGADRDAARRERGSSMPTSRMSVRAPRWAVALIGGLVLLTTAGASRWFGARVVEAERIVLRDADGRIRAELSTDDDGETHLRFLDAGGRDRLALRTGDGDTAALELYDGGRLRLAVASGSGGQASVRLYGDGLVNAAALYLGPDHAAGLELSGPTRRIDLASQGDGTAGLAIGEPGASRPRHTLGLPPDVRVRREPAGVGSPPFTPMGMTRLGATSPPTANPRLRGLAPAGPASP